MKSLPAVTAALTVFLGAPLVFAAEGHHEPHIGQIIYPAINFLIFAYIIKRFALPPVMGFLSSRRETVVKTVNEAAQEKTGAEALVRDYRDRLAGLDQEIQKIQSEFRTEGERDKARILREAQGLAAKIKADAAFQVEQEFKAARHRLRSELARLAQEAAEAMLRAEIGQADQKRLAQEFIGKLGAVR